MQVTDFSALGVNVVGVGSVMYVVKFRQLTPKSMSRSRPAI